MPENIHSLKIDHILDQIALDDKELKKLFQGCLKSIWANTMIPQLDGRVHVTGVNPRVMSLMESTSLMRPLSMISKNDAGLQVLLRGVIEAQLEMIITDPYADQFAVKPVDSDNPANDTTPVVKQRHFNLESLLSPVHLVWSYWMNTGDDTIFDETTLEALMIIFQTLRIEQNHDELSEYDAEGEAEEPTDKETPLILRPNRPNGMIWSAYRPNGTPCFYNYHIPSQMSAVIAMNYLVEILRDVYTDQDVAEEVMDFQYHLNNAIEAHGLIDHPDYGMMYLYEVDGLENSLMMDEAEMPSLLGSVVFGYSAPEDILYKNTMKFIQTKENPSYIPGKQISGMGTKIKGKPWVSTTPLILQAMTTDNPLEQYELIGKLKTCHGGTYQMPRYMNPDNLEKPSTEKSNLANALFIELALVKLAGIY